MGTNQGVCRMEGWAGVVLAGGMGTRMKSRVPKVLHQVCGQEMIRYPITALREAGIERVVGVVSPVTEKRVRDLLGESVEYVRQSEAMGTGDALFQATPLLKDQVSQVVVLQAGSPLIRSATIQALYSLHVAQDACITLLSGHQSIHQKLGEVVRNEEGQVVRIVEPDQSEGSGAQSSEVNGGAYCFQAFWLWDNLGEIPREANGESFLPTLVSMAHSQTMKVEVLESEDSDEVLGVKNRVHLAQIEAILYQRIRQQMMLDGVTMMDPLSTFIDASVEMGQDTVIYPNTMILGKSSIGEECRVGPYSVIRDCRVGSRCLVTASFLEGAVLEEDVSIGPFSRLRTGTILERGVRVGNFAEIKNSRIGQRTAMGHFGYVGDASVGPNVNLGAGLVTCNYDGINHNETIVEDGAFIGSDTMLIAPVRVGAGSTTAAGSVITCDVPSGGLAVGMPARIRKSKRNTVK